jgi:hypothetical protein
VLSALAPLDAVAAGAIYSRCRAPSVSLARKRTVLPVRCQYEQYDPGPKRYLQRCLS